MIALEPASDLDKVTAHAVEAPVSDDSYAMVDSGNNATIAPLHPEMCGEIAKCKVPRATLKGPIAQALKRGQERRLRMDAQYNL